MNPRPQNLSCRSDAGFGGLDAVAALDRNEPGHAHGRAEDGDANQLFLEQGGAPAGQARNEHRRIEVGDVVGHEDARCVRWHIL